MPVAASNLYCKAAVTTSNPQPDVNHNVELQDASDSQVNASCVWPLLAVSSFHAAWMSLQELPCNIGLQAVRKLLPDAANHLQSFMQPFVQEHNVARDAAEVCDTL